MIKLKSMIQMIQEESKILFYNTETRQILIEIDITKEDDIDPVEFKHIAYYFRSVEQIANSKFKRLLLTLYKRKPEFFDVISEDNSDQGMIQNDFELTVNRDAFFLTFDYAVTDKLKKKDIVFWGESQLTQLLTHSMSKIVNSLTVYQGNGATNTDFDYPKGVELQQNEDMIKWRGNSNVIHVVYENAFNSAQLIYLTELLAKEKASVLYYKAAINEFLIGPLVLGDETSSYEDYDIQYPIKQGDLSVSIAYIGAGIINRILYFLLIDSLEYIGEDAQLPINSVFKMNMYTLELETLKIFKGVSHNESRSRKYFQTV